MDQSFVLMTHSVVIAAAPMIRYYQSEAIATARPRDILKEVLESLGDGFVGTKI